MILKYLILYENLTKVLLIEMIKIQNRSFFFNFVFELVERIFEFRNKTERHKNDLNEIKFVCQNKNKLHFFSYKFLIVFNCS